jgi:hypothetical protein
VDECAKGLQWAWNLDRQRSGYPVNTWIVFVQTQDSLLRGPSEVRKGVKAPPPPPPPQTLSELLSERAIAGVYHEQNEGNYRDALKRAASGDTRSWRKILRAIDASYFICLHGAQAAPTPRINFLHRNLLEIVDLVKLSDLMHEGIVEFLDDICPCGERHTKEAIRKLRKRYARVSRGDS